MSSSPGPIRFAIGLGLCLLAGAVHAGQVEDQRALDAVFGRQLIATGDEQGKIYVFSRDGTVTRTNADGGGEKQTQPWALKAGQLCIGPDLKDCGIISLKDGVVMLVSGAQVIKLTLGGPAP